MGIRPGMYWLPVVLGAAPLWFCGPALATSWTIGLGAGSSGGVQAQPKPSAPAAPAAVCTKKNGTTIDVNWTGVAHVSTYTVYVSTTSAGTGYTVAASGVTATSWRSASLAIRTYWNAVAAVVGTNWASANSTPNAQTTITSKCAQP